MQGLKSEIFYCIRWHETIKAWFHVRVPYEAYDERNIFVTNL